MSSVSNRNNSTIRTLSLAAFILGGLLLLVIPTLLIFFAVSDTKNAQLNGTLVILSATGGMGLIALGALMRA